MNRIYKYFLALMFLSITAFSHAQDNGDFETLSSGCTVSNNVGIDPTAPFQDGCVPYWRASHGTPQIVDTNGNRAYMWAGDYNCNGFTQLDGGEGIFIDCDFKEGKSYTLSMDFSSVRPGFVDGYIVEQINVLLVNNLNSQASNQLCPGQTTLYAIPNIASNNKQLIFQEASFQSFGAGFANRTFNFIPNQDYTSLWIYPNHPKFGRVHLLVDNVTSLPGECPPDEEYSNTSNLPGFTERYDYIHSFENTNVLASQDVTFVAGEEIILHPGFCAENGSNFLAYIEDCQRGELRCLRQGEGGEGDDGDGDGGWDEDRGERKSSDWPLNLEPTKGFAVYPNPTAGQVTVEVSVMAENLTVQVVDLYGKLITSTPLLHNRHTIDLGELENGVYVVSILQDTDIQFRKKIILTE